MRAVNISQVKKKASIVLEFHNVCTFLSSGGGMTAGYPGILTDRPEGSAQ
jgi:hypothetical protein